MATAVIHYVAAAVSDRGRKRPSNEDAFGFSVEDFVHPLDTQDIKGQLVEVYDSISGKLLLKAPANPILDAGGNVAISPSGKRVAILNSGAIEVYELPTPEGSSQPTSASIPPATTKAKP